MPTRLLLVGAILLASQSVLASPTVSTHRGCAMDEYVARQADYGFSGAVLVAEGDKILLSKGYGLANRDTRASIDEHTRFNLASIT